MRGRKSVWGRWIGVGKKRWIGRGDIDGGQIAGGADSCEVWFLLDPGIFDEKITCRTQRSIVCEA